MSLDVSAVQVVPPFVVYDDRLRAGRRVATDGDAGVRVGQETPNRPANGFGPPEPGTLMPGVVTGVVCSVHEVPPLEVTMTRPQ